MIAALFLFCSYFGTDQSQVQRYLTARSVDEARHSLLMSAYWKIPLQLLVLLLGVLVFVFYVFTPPPLLFSTAQTERLRTGELGAGVRGARDRVPEGVRQPGGRRPLSSWRRVTPVMPGASRRGRSPCAARGGGQRGAEPRRRARAREQQRSPVLRRQLHHADLHPHRAPDRPGRPSHPRDHHGRHRYDRRRVELALDRDRDRLLQAHISGPSETTRTTSGSRRS